MGTATYYQVGDTIAYTNPSAENALSYGDVVDLDTRIGIVAADIAASGTGNLAVSNVWKLPASDSEAFTVGQVVYWDAENEELVGDGSGKTRAGWVTAVKAETGTSAYICID